MTDPVSPLKLPLTVELPDGETCELVDADGKVIATDAECAEDNLFSVQESRSHFEQLAHFANRHAELLAELGILKGQCDELRAALTELVALKAMKDQADHGEMYLCGHEGRVDMDDYKRRKPLAWAAARRVLGWRTPMPNPSRPSRLRVKQVKRKPRIEPPGTIPRVGDKIVKVRRCFRAHDTAMPIGTRATVVKVVRDPGADDNGAWTERLVKGAIVSPRLIEFEACGGWRVCKRKKARNA